MLNYYDILEVVNVNSSSDEIKKSFKRLAFKYHPDINPGDEAAKEKMVELIEAYDVLSNPVSRNWYNMRAGKEDILSHFEDVYKQYSKTKAERHEDIKQELEADRAEVKQAYEKANQYVSFRLKIPLYAILMFIALEGMFTIVNAEGDERNTILLLVYVLALAISFIKIGNILYLESLYNKHFRPEGKIREENVPYYMLYILIICMIILYFQPRP